MSNNVEILRENEFEKLIDHMDKSFEMKEGFKFRDVLPKLYINPNFNNMVHFVIKDNEKIVSSIGLYDCLYMSKYSTLKVGFVGGVSTDKEYEKKGLMTKIMNTLIDYSIKNNYDLLVLTGDRIRYSYFGFEEAGRVLFGGVTKKSISKLEKHDYKLVEATNLEHYKIISDLYNKNNIVVKRDLNDYEKVLRTWKSIPYLVYEDEELIGYYSISKNIEIQEIFYNDEKIDTMLEACLDNRDYVNIRFPFNKLSNELINKLHTYEIENVMQFKILNLKNVMKFMNINDEYYDDIKNTENKQMIRDIFGFKAYDSKYSKMNFSSSSLDFC